MAPELLRELFEGRKLSTSSVLLVKGASKRQMVPMSQEGDIYASAIIIKEIVTRSGPYTEYEDLTPKGGSFSHLRFKFISFTVLITERWWCLGDLMTMRAGTLWTVCRCYI